MRRSSLVLLFMIAACSHTPARQASEPTPSADTQAFRIEQPLPAQRHEFVGPVPSKQILPNGLTVMVIEKHELPLVAVQVVVRSGASSDVKGHEGVAQMTANMLQWGTVKRTAAQIDEAIEILGTTIQTSADLDATQAFVQVLRDNLPQAFDVLADVVQNPAFPADELERVRTQMRTTLLQERDVPSRLASRALFQTLYGDHPYGRTAAVTPELINKIKRDDLKVFHAQHFRPDNTAVILIGDIKAEDAAALVAQRFGGWKSGATSCEAKSKKTKLPWVCGALPVASAVTPRKPNIILVPRAGAAQAQILAGHVSVPRASPDYFPLVLTNLVLGGQFNSRINMNLREDKGYTYGASSGFYYGRGPGPFFVATSTRPEVAAPAIHELVLEVRKIRESGVTEAELGSAKSNYIESLPGEFETSRAL
ncbi:MAG: insulinase family protein, partial [Clostridia bacterium]|nr:insulinase family protein [Deltaproteobacteria bacterium]